MDNRTVSIQGEKIKFDSVIKFVLAQPKEKAIEFFTTKAKLSKPDATYVVHEIHIGKYDRAYQMLNPHDDCSTPITGGRDYTIASHRNPFLIEENAMGKSTKYVIYAVILIMIAALLAGYFSMKTVG